MSESKTITRTEFVRAYCERSGISSEWAELGLIDLHGFVKIALPCGCYDEDCEGWAMCSAESALSHLDLYAPTALRQAYRKAVEQCGGMWK